MQSTIKAVFDKEIPNLKVDNTFVNSILKYERDIANKNKDHIDFLGGNLLGTPNFRFHPSDRNRLFDEILKVDDGSLEAALHDLAVIDPTRKVSSDVFNLSVTYVLHVLYASRLSASLKHAGMMAILKVMHYRFISSSMAHNFKYTPDRAVVEAVYVALTYKHSLKVHGSWGALITHRCEDILSKNSIHFKAISQYDDDERIIRLITDPQTRIRGLIRLMANLFYEIRDKPARVRTKSSTFIDTEGMMSIKDLTRKYSEYSRYAHEVMKDRSTFIRDDLVGVIADAMHTMPVEQLNEALRYMVDNYGIRGDKKVKLLIDETLLHVYSYMSATAPDFKRGINFTMLLSKMRALYMSSRSSDPALLKIRDLSLHIAKSSVKTTNSSLLASIRTGILLYIVLRTFAKNYYLSSGSIEHLKQSA